MEHGISPVQRRYPPELRERAVRMVQDLIAEHGRQRFGVVTRAARSSALAPSLAGLVEAGRHRRRAPAGDVERGRAAIAELEREVRELRRANDILEAESVFSATELDGRPNRSSPSSTPTGRGSPVGCDGGVEPICHVLEIAPSTYYDIKTWPPSARQLRDAELAPKLKALWRRTTRSTGGAR